MRFSIHPETKNLELKHVHAIVGAFTSDLMIPDRGHDLRFQQRVTSRLRELQYHTQPQIQEFLSMSQLNTRRGPVETPPTLTLSIPPHLYGSATADQDINPPQEPTQVPYLFAGVEFRTTLAITFRDWRVLYTSIDAGNEQGHRSEVSLRPRRAQSTVRRDGREMDSQWRAGQTQDFIDTAYQLVDFLEESDVESVVRDVPSKFLPKIGNEGRSLNGQKEVVPFNYFRRSITFAGNNAQEVEHLTTDKADES
jgi:hypothetical protein